MANFFSFQPNKGATPPEEEFRALAIAHGVAKTYVDEEQRIVLPGQLQPAVDPEVCLPIDQPVVLTALDIGLHNCDSKSEGHEVPPHPEDKMIVEWRRKWRDGKPLLAHERVKMVASYRNFVNEDAWGAFGLSLIYLVQYGKPCFLKTCSGVHDKNEYGEAFATPGLFCGVKLAEPSDKS